MPLESFPTPPHPPPNRSYTRFLEPDEQSGTYLHKRIERDLPQMADDAQIVRDTILDSQPNESRCERARRDYERSMNHIQELGHQEFPRQLGNEMSERKWALDSIDSNSPDIVRQFQWIRQWILNSIRSRKIDNEQHSPFIPPDAPPNSEEERSTSPQQLSDSERGPDESSEDGYGTSELEGGVGECDELGETADKEGEDEEERFKGDPTPLHYSPSPPSAPLTQSFRSKSPVSRRNATSRKRQPFQLAKDIIENNADDAHKHPPWRHESQPYSHSGAPRRRNSGSQATNWRLVPRSLDEAISSPTSATPSLEIYGSQRSPEDPSPTTPQKGPRGTWDSLNSRSSFGGFFKPRLPPVDGDLSDESDNFVGHPDVLQNVRSIRNVRSATKIEQLAAWRKNEARRGEEASRKEEEASRKEEEARRLEERARQSLEEAKCLEACARQTEASTKMHDAAVRIKEDKVMRKEAEVKKCEADVQKRGAEAQRKEENARYRELEARLKEEQARWKEEAAQRKEDDLRKREEEVRRREEEATQMEGEVSRKAEEARRLEVKARHSLEEAQGLEACARRAEASAKMREAAVKNKEVEVNRKEAETRKCEADAQKRETEARREEEKARYRELESRLKEEQAHRKEEAAQRKEEDLRRREEEVRRKEEEVTHKEEEARKREEKLRRLEEKARQSLEEAKRLEADARQAETYVERCETDTENEEAETGVKRDEIEVNFLAEASVDICKS